MSAPPDRPATLFFAKGSCALGSVIGLEWLGRPYQLVRLEKSDHDNPTYRRFNPTGEVPTLLVGDRAVCESVAVLHLAAADAASRLAPPRHAPAYDLFNTVLGYLTTSVHPGFAPFFHADRLAGSDPGAQEAVRRAGLRRLPERYARIESFLARTGWLAGDGPTLVDAYLLGIVRWGDGLVDPSPHPRLRALRARLSDDPAVRFALAAEEGDDVPASAAFGGFLTLPELATVVLAEDARGP